MYELKLDYSYVSLHREDVGIQGSWDAYFSLLQNAVESIRLTESGDMELYYPLMQGARIKGTLVLGPEHEIKGMARHERIREMLIGFVKKAQEPNAAEKGAIPQKPLVPEVSILSKKRIRPLNAPSMSLLNPNKKLKQPEGAKFTKPVRLSLNSSSSNND